MGIGGALLIYTVLSQFLIKGTTRKWQLWIFMREMKFNLFLPPKTSDLFLGWTKVNKSAKVTIEQECIGCRRFSDIATKMGVHQDFISRRQGRR